MKMDKCASTELELIVYIPNATSQFFPPRITIISRLTHPLHFPPTIQLPTSIRSQSRWINSHPHKSLSTPQRAQIQGLNLPGSLPNIQSPIINHTHKSTAPQNIQIFPISGSIQTTGWPTQWNCPFNIPREGISERDGGGTG